MKKLLVLALVALSFAACNKDDEHCYSCYFTRTYPDKNNNYTTVTADTIKMCDWTDQAKNVYEGTHKGATHLDTIISETRCIQQPDK